MKAPLGWGLIDSGGPPASKRVTGKIVGDLLPLVLPKFVVAGGGAFRDAAHCYTSRPRSWRWVRWPPSTGLWPIWGLLMMDQIASVLGHFFAPPHSRFSRLGGAILSCGRVFVVPTFLGDFVSWRTWPMSASGRRSCLSVSAFRTGNLRRLDVIYNLMIRWVALPTLFGSLVCVCRFLFALCGSFRFICVLVIPTPCTSRFVGSLRDAHFIFFGIWSQIFLCGRRWCLYRAVEGGASSTLDACRRGRPYFYAYVSASVHLASHPCDGVFFLKHLARFSF